MAGPPIGLLARRRDRKGGKMGEGTVLETWKAWNTWNLPWWYLLWHGMGVAGGHSNLNPLPLGSSLPCRLSPSRLTRLGTLYSVHSTLYFLFFLFDYNLALPSPASFQGSKPRRRLTRSHHIHHINHISSLAMCSVVGPLTPGNCVLPFRSGRPSTA